MTQLVIHVINRDTGMLSAYTPSQLLKMARAWAKPTGKSYQQHWVEFDQKGNSRLMVQTLDKFGWSEANGIAI